MEATIGFDLRSTVSDLSWTVDRRTRFLLRRDVTSVRSVDPLVWARPLELPPAPEAEGLWSNLAALFAAAHALDHAYAMAVRITALEEDGPTPDRLPEHAPDRWRPGTRRRNQSAAWPASCGLPGVFAWSTRASACW